MAAPGDPSGNVSLSWISPIFDYSGYAMLSRSVIPRLERLGAQIQLRCFDIDQNYIADLQARPGEFEAWKERLSRQIQGDVHVVFHQPTLIDGTNFYAIQRQQFPGFKAYVGLTMLETDRLSDRWLAGCRLMDEIWVPSQFNRETFTQSGVDADRIQVIPFGLDAQAWDPALVVPMDLQGRRGFNFLSVFQWNRRKGWDVLLKAYLEAFTAKDDVSLILRTYPDRIKEPPISERIAKYVNELGYDFEKIPDLILYEDFIPEDWMPSLYRVADAFVLPTRGEGWGIPFMEAMAMGLPAIGTKWSAHLDFMNEENSYLIDLDGFSQVDREHVMENPHYTEEQQWAEPSWQHTAELMRYVFEHRSEAKEKGSYAQGDIRQNWTLERTAKKIVERIGHLSGKKSFSQGDRALDTELLIGVQEKNPEENGRRSHQKLTIGVDARTLTYSRSTARGIGQYTFHHLRALMSETPTWNYILCLEDLPQNDYLGELLNFANCTWCSFDDIGTKHMDLFFVPDPMNLIGGFDSPFRLAPSAPLSALVYDLIPLVLPKKHLDKRSPEEELGYMRRLRQLKNSQAQMLAISENTRRDIREHLGTPDSHIEVIMAGPNHVDSEVTVSPDSIASVLAKYNLKIPFFLSVGSLDPHKNFMTALHGFIEASSIMPMQFAVVGSMQDPHKSYLAEYLPQNNIHNVVFPGFVSRKELRCLYAAASGLLFLSRYEGFGFPVLEAMSHGCPVITTNAASLPEVAGDAALLVSPDDSNTVKEHMLRLVRDSSLRTQLIQRGVVQARKFSWEETARKTIAAWTRFLASKAESSSVGTRLNA